MSRPPDPFPPATFRARRERVLAALDGSAMVLPAAQVRYASRDTEYAYRPDSELYWVTGVTEPGAVAVLRAHADENRFVLFVRSRDEEAERWSGPRLGPEGAAEAFGADETHPIDELEERLPQLLRSARYVYFRLGGDDRVEALVRRALHRARRRGPRKGEGPRGVLDPGEVLDDMRLVKDADELRRLREAARITCEAHREAMSRVHPGMGEWEVEAVLDGAFRRLGAGGAGYPIIVGSGCNACVLHYVENSDAMDDGELVLVDAGASVGLYTADLTRTYAVGGAFTAEQRTVYEIVDRARRAALDAVGPGATTADVHDAAVRVVVDGLLAADVFEGDPEELVAEEEHKAFFPHNTSHWLGLDVHDPGDYAREGEPRTLEPGMALTVEPGLYFGPDVEGEAEPFRCIGVRIEDDVIVTDEGRQVLTSDVPTDPEELEALVGSEPAP